MDYKYLCGEKPVLTFVIAHQSFMSHLFHATINQTNEEGETRSMSKMVLLQPKYIKKFKAEKEKDHEKNNHKYKKGIKSLNKNMYVS